MTEKSPEKSPPESDEYARFKELTRKLVAVPKAEVSKLRKQKQSRPRRGADKR